MHDGGSSLVIGEYECIGDKHVLSPPSGENDGLSNIVWRQRFAAPVTWNVRINEEWVGHETYA